MTEDLFFFLKKVVSARNYFFHTRLGNKMGNKSYKNKERLTGLTQVSFLKLIQPNTDK